MKYKGIVRDVYKYEIEVEADNTDEAIRKLKEIHDSDEIEGVFVADGYSYEKSTFSLKL